MKIKTMTRTETKSLIKEMKELYKNVKNDKDLYEQSKIFQSKHTKEECLRFWNNMQWYNQPCHNILSTATAFHLMA